MAYEFFIKRNDTSPSIRVICKDGDGEVVSVTGATIRFHMFDKAGTEVVDAAGSINDGAAGDIQYDWQAADTDVSGIFNAEFEVTFADGSIETFPNYGYIKVRVYEDLA